MHACVLCERNVEKSYISSIETFSQSEIASFFPYKTMAKRSLGKCSFGENKCFWRKRLLVNVYMVDI